MSDLQLMYGTAWKEDRTRDLVRLALEVGYRAIDTANQRKHYVEAAVGAAVADSGVPREQLFLQTKYTYADGQDHRLPYDPRADITTQVQQSFASSCEHLGVERIDSYVLHGPRWNRGWSPEDEEAWAAMEALAREGRAGRLGVSNVALDQLATLCRTAAVPPAFVQNRCYARTGWDQAVRELCRERGIVYQGFSLLTANARELSQPRVVALAERAGGTVPQLVFRWARAVGMLPLTGTTQRRHMEEDLAAIALPLDAATRDEFERLTMGRR